VALQFGPRDCGTTGFGTIASSIMGKPPRKTRIMSGAKRKRSRKTRIMSEVKEKAAEKTRIMVGSKGEGGWDELDHGREARRRRRG
jgi:hypothetical protein